MLKNALIRSLEQVQEILDFTSKLDVKEREFLYCEQGAGRHIRHILDHYIALIQSVESRVIDYNIRRRDTLCETCTDEASKIIQDLTARFKEHNLENCDLKVISEVDIQETKTAEFFSNFSREALYVINHTIHHTAYISLIFKMNNFNLKENIGLAPATATFFRKTG